MGGGAGAEEGISEFYLFIYLLFDKVSNSDFSFGGAGTGDGGGELSG